MAGIIEKRLSLHKSLTEQKQQNDVLKSQLTRLNTLANVGSATYMIAHEINNLLTPVSNYAELALQNLADKPLCEKALGKTVKGCRQAAGIMESMVALANDEDQQKQQMRLADSIEQIFACLCRDFSKDGIEVKIEVDADLTVWAVPVQIQQVLMNLILNARDAMLENGGILTIKAEQSDENVQIRVFDTGCGIETANLQNIFEAFFTTKSGRESSSAGLGLAFCKRIVDSHNGCISVESARPGATVFKITLPKDPAVRQ